MLEDIPILPLISYFFASNDGTPSHHPSVKVFLNSLQEAKKSLNQLQCSFRANEGKITLGVKKNLLGMLYEKEILFLKSL